MKILVTRPVLQAAEWVGRLREQGIEAQALPLIGIAAAPDTAAVHAAWAGLQALELAVFVSPNAAEQFFALKPVAQGWPPGVLAGSPGPGTSHTLRQLGVPATAIVEPAHDAAQFDSEALWLQLAPHGWAGKAVLIVRGDGGRDWLAQALSEHGAVVAHLAAYRRTAPTFDAGQQSVLNAALAAPARHLWLFSSSEAIDHLAAAVPGNDWSAAQALATHPRIAERAAALGFGRVLRARPEFSAVVACIQSFTASNPP